MDTIARERLNVKMTENAERDRVELRFVNAPNEELKQVLRDHEFRLIEPANGEQSYWYAPRNGNTLFIAKTLAK